jgi:very-short-patch-repair endonuclease
MWGYIADFYCPKLRLCLEVDGGYHRPEIDNYRDQALANHGITTLRFSNAQVLRGIDAVLAKIKDFANSQRTSKKAQLGALIQPGNLAIAASNATYDAINTP